MVDRHENLDPPTSGREGTRIVNWKRAQWLFLAADVAAITAAGVLTRRMRQMQEQAWFWTPSWLAGEAEADADIREGRFQRYDNAEQFLKALDADAAGAQSGPLHVGAYPPASCRPSTGLPGSTPT